MGTLASHLIHHIMVFSEPLEGIVHFSQIEFLIVCLTDSHSCAPAMVVISHSAEYLKCIQYLKSKKVEYIKIVFICFFVLVEMMGKNSLRKQAFLIQLFDDSALLSASRLPCLTF